MRAVGDEYATQQKDPDYQVVSLCTAVGWWIDALEAGVYEWRPEVARWAVSIVKPDSPFFLQRLTGLV